MGCWTEIRDVSVFKDNKWQSLEIKDFICKNIGGGRDLDQYLDHIGHLESFDVDNYTISYKLNDLLKLQSSDIDHHLIPNFIWILENLTTVMNENNIDLPEHVKITINYDP